MGLLARVCGIVTAGFGIAALAGWIAGIPSLCSFGTDMVPMAPSTALLFLLYGILPLFLSQISRNHKFKVAMVLPCLTAIAVSTLLLSTSLSGRYLDAEHLFIDISGTFEGIPTGHMSPATAFCFIFSGISFLLLVLSSKENHRTSFLAFCAAALVLMASLIFSAAYFLGGPFLYGSNLIPPALPTSFALMSLGISLLMASGDNLRRKSQLVSDRHSAISLFVLVMVFAICALGIIIASYFHLRNNGRQFRAGIEQQISAVADLKVSELNQFRKERLGDASILHKNPSLSLLVKQYFDGIDVRRNKAELENWLAKYHSGCQYDRVLLLDSSGNIRLSMPEKEESLPEPVRKSVTEAIKTGEIVFQDFYRNESSGNLHLSLVVPVRGGDREKPVGAIVLRIDPSEYIYPLIGKWPTPSETSETLLVRRDGDDVLFLNELKFRKNSALSLRIPLARKDVPAARAALGYEGIMEGVDYRGMPVIAAIRTVPGSPWFLVSRTSSEEVYAPLRGQTREMLLVIAAILFGLGTGVWLIWRSQQMRFYREKFLSAEAMREKEAGFRRTLDNMMEGCQIIGFDWSYLYLNDSAAKFGRQKKEDMIGRTVMEIFPGFEKTEMYFFLNRCMEKREADNSEFKFAFQDGSSGWHELSTLPVPEGLFILSLDITGRKHAEERIRKLNRVYAVLSDINQAIVRIRDQGELFSKACDIAVEKGNFPLAWIGLVDEVTQKFQITAFSGQDKGGYLNEVISSVNDNRPNPCTIRSSLSHGEHAICSSIGCADMGSNHCRKDAGTLGFLSAASFPLKVSGKTKGVISFHACERDFFDEEEVKLLDELAMDISFSMEFSEKEIQRISTENSLHESEGKYRQIVESLSGEYFFYRHNVNGVFEYVSPSIASILGYSSGEFCRNYTSYLTDNSANQERIRHTEGSIRGEQQQPYLVEIRHRNGNIHTLRVIEMPVIDKSGNVIAVSGIANDITERKRLEDESEKLKNQLIQSQKMEAVGQLAGGVAHDFNNMLQVILGYANMAAAEVPAEGDVAKYLLEIRKASQRSSDLTRQLLAFARKQTIIPQVLDLNETMAGMLKMLGRLIGENIELLWKPGNGLWLVKMDPTQLDQVLANITVNARDAIQGSGRIIIETRNADVDGDFCRMHADAVPGRYVELSISDSGCGMDKETISRIFEPFFTTKPLGKGTGLGLATVYGIVRQNDGFIGVYSEPGKGTTFKLYFPSDASEKKTEKEESEAEQALPGGSETILIAEDEKAILTLSGRILQQLGYTVIATDSPHKAVQLSEGHGGEIHLLVTDVVMPEMNGRDLWNSLREKRPGIKCIFMSGYTSNVIAHHGVLDKDVNFLEKPFTASSLAVKIREALGK